MRPETIPGKYTKKPVTIDAFRMGIDPRPDWFTEKVTRNEIVTREAPGESYNGPFGFTKTCCEIQTLEGVMRGEYGDWIIRGVKGEVYPCKPDIFAMTYEPALPSPAAPLEALRDAAEMVLDHWDKQGMFGLGACMMELRDAVRAPSEGKEKGPGALVAVYSVKGRLGAYLNTMVADLGIEGKGQYLRDLFGKWEEEMDVAYLKSRLGAKVTRETVEALTLVTKAPGLAADMMRREGFVFDNSGGRWEKLAFSLYTDLVSLRETAEVALAALSSIAPSDPYPIHTEDGYCRKAPGEKGK